MFVLMFVVCPIMTFMLCMAALPVYFSMDVTWMMMRYFLLVLGVMVTPVNVVVMRLYKLMMCVIVSRRRLGGGIMDVKMAISGDFGGMTCTFTFVLWSRMMGFVAGLGT